MSEEKDCIDKEYLEFVQNAIGKYKKWMENETVPVLKLDARTLTLNTETTDKIYEFINSV